MPGAVPSLEAHNPSRLPRASRGSYTPVMPSRKKERAEEPPARGRRASTARKQESKSPAKRPRAARRTAEPEPAPAREGGARRKKPAPAVSSAKKSTPAASPAKKPAARKTSARAVSKPRARRRKASDTAPPLATATFLSRIPRGLQAGDLELPEGYGVPRVRLLVQGPARLFAYWDVAPGLVEGLQQELGPRAAALTRLALLLAPAGASEGASVVLLPRSARSCYLDLTGEPVEYEAELGLKLPSGQFRSLARSNRVRLPRGGPSSVAARRTVAVSLRRYPSARALGELPEDADVSSGASAAGRRNAGTRPALELGGSSEMQPPPRRPRARTPTTASPRR
jgi:hypothetical protein